MRSTGRSTRRATASEPGPLDIPAKSNTSPAEFRIMVRRPRTHPGRRYFPGGAVAALSGAIHAAAAGALRALRRVNPAPFLYFLDFGGYAIAGSSPEVLVRLRDGTVTIRRWPARDRAAKHPMRTRRWRKQLLADPKERAEHLMLLDLGRNDVGRVSKIGSVKVTDQFFIERYSHVMHIVSNVEGALATSTMRSTRWPRVFRRHGVGGAEGAGDADYRRAGEGKRGLLRRLRRLFPPPPAKWTAASCSARAD